MHTISKKLQHEEEKDDVLMGGGKGGLKKKKLADGTAMTIPNPPQQTMQSTAMQM